MGSPGPHRAERRALVRKVEKRGQDADDSSDIDLLCYCECIIDFNSPVPDGALDFGVPRRGSATDLFSFEAFERAGHWACDDRRRVSPGICLALHDAMLRISHLRGANHADGPITSYSSSRSLIGSPVQWRPWWPLLEMLAGRQRDQETLAHLTEGVL